MNVWEELVREWYELRGYWTKANVRFAGTEDNPQENGEIDLVALNPRQRVLVHVEIGGGRALQDDVDRIRQQFERAQPHYADLFDGGYDRVERIGIILYVAHIGNDVSLPEEISFRISRKFMSDDIVAEIRDNWPINRAVPDRLPLLRTIQEAILAGAFE